MNQTTTTDFTAQLRQLQGQYAVNQLVQPCLFYGPNLAVQRQCARAFVLWHFCQNPVDQACMQCDACQQCTLETHPDYLVIRPEKAQSPIKIDAVRCWIMRISRTSQQKKARIAVIEHADNMTLSAANALLKTLEEPPPRRIIFLLARRPRLLPITLYTRCQRILFPSAAPIDTDCLAFFTQYLRFQPPFLVCSPAHMADKAVTFPVMPLLDAGMQYVRSQLLCYPAYAVGLLRFYHCMVTLKRNVTVSPQLDMALQYAALFVQWQPEKWG